MGDLGVQEKLGRYDEVHEHATKALLVFPDRPLVEAYNKLCELELLTVSYTFRCCTELIHAHHSSYTAAVFNLRQRKKYLVGAQEPLKVLRMTCELLPTYVTLACPRCSCTHIRFSLGVFISINMKSLSH